MNKLNKIKEIFENAESTIVSVTYVKSDGSLRTASCNPKAKRGVAGDKASDQAKQATNTRKVNNPNLVSYYDNTVASRGEVPSKCWRSFNAERVVQVKSKGKTWDFE